MDAKATGAMKELEQMARDINADLPADLQNHVVSITMSKDGIRAKAIPIEDTWKEPYRDPATSKAE